MTKKLTKSCAREQQAASLEPQPGMSVEAYLQQLNNSIFDSTPADRCNAIDAALIDAIMNESTERHQQKADGSDEELQKLLGLH